MEIKRADNLKKCLGKNQSLKSGYNAVLKDLEENGIVYEEPVKELKSQVLYLRHRPVVSEPSTIIKISI